MKATTIVHWPGKDSLACDDHTAKLAAVAGAMGFRVSARPYFGDEECANCANEAKRPAPATLPDKEKET